MVPKNFKLITTQNLILHLSVVLVLFSTWTSASCTRPPSFPNSARTYTSSSNDSMANYTCDLGYENDVSTVVTWTCNSSGIWDGPAFSCKAVNCSTPPNVPHASAMYYDTTYQATAVYTCDEGYLPDVTAASVACQADRMWETVNISCQIIDCGLPPSIANSFQTFDGITTYASQSHYQCWSGHTYLSGSQFSVTCSYDNGSAIWVGYQRKFKFCWKISSYYGCFSADPNIIGSFWPDRCIQLCFETSMTYAALRGDECACLITTEAKAVSDSYCNMTCGVSGRLCGGNNSLWSVYTIFAGCYSNMTSSDQFQTYNNITCREYCRGQGHSFAAFFVNDHSCRCLDKTDHNAVGENSESCIPGFAPDISGLALVYTLDKEPLAGSTCQELFKNGVYRNGFYFLVGSTAPVQCTFYDGTVCGDKWLGYKGNCYLWSYDINSTSYSEATKFCASQDSLLVSINNPDEALFIKTVFQSLPWYGAIDKWYIGLYDQFKMFVAQWADGSLFQYSSYATSQPSGYYEQCNYLLQSYSESVNTWYDDNCVDPRKFICEQSKEVYGCVSIPKADLVGVYNVTKATEMSLTLCFITCRSLDANFSAVSIGTCYCMSTLPARHSRLPFSECLTGCPGNIYQLCGNQSSSSVVVAFVIQDSGQVYAESCAELEQQGITGPTFKMKVNGIIQTVQCMENSSVACPYAWVYRNGRCYKYFTQIGMDPHEICGRDLESYVALIDSPEEQEALFNSDDTTFLKGNTQWVIGLFNFQNQGVFRTSNGRPLAGLMYPNTSLPANCLSYNMSSNDVQTTACATKPFVCEKGPEYLGCAQLTSTPEGLVIYNYTDMSIIQCVETCRGLSNRYASVGSSPFTCYCTNTPPLKTTVQCTVLCYDQLSQVCGGPGGKVSVYVVDTYPMFATSCEDLYREGLLLPGTYMINGQPRYCYMKDNTSCSQVDTTLWTGVGNQGSCFKLSYYSMPSENFLQTCKNHTQLSIPASLRSEEERDFFNSLYYKRKDAYRQNSILLGAVDQFLLGCFSWADGWLFDLLHWSPGYPNVNYGQSNSSNLEIFALIRGNMTLYNGNSTEIHPALCREVTDYRGCFIKPTVLSASIENYSSMGITLCKQICLGKNKSLALVDTLNCFCLDVISGLVSAQANEIGCDIECPANSLQSCAKPGFLRAYAVDFSDISLNCSILHANFILLQDTYMLKNSSSGEITPSVCGFADNTACPPGFMGNKGKCYRFFPMNYKDAKEAASYCTSYGSYLATPRNSEEVAFIRTAVNSVPSLSSIRKWRIGIVDLMQGNYYPSSDGSFMASLMWNETTTETTILQKENTTAEVRLCATLSLDYEKWISDNCSSPLSFICETGPVFEGCKKLNSAQIASAFHFYSSSLTVQQCVAMCYGQNTRYALVRSNNCDCVQDEVWNGVTVACDSTCLDSFSQNCGSSSLDVAAVYNIDAYSQEDKTAKSCPVLRQYAVTIQGFYYLDIGNGRNLRVSCGTYGRKFQDILKLDSANAQYASSSNFDEAVQAVLDMSVLKWVTWKPNVTDSVPWLQVTLSDYFLVKAVVITGSWDPSEKYYVTEFKLYQGLSSNVLYPYSEMLRGINATKTELAVSFLRDPFVARAVRIYPTQWFQLPSLAFTLLGEAYITFQHDDLYIGCFADPCKTMLSMYATVVSMQECRSHCADNGYGMFGLAVSKFSLSLYNNCACVTNVGEFGELDVSSCNFTCDNSSSPCGSDANMSVAVYRVYEKQCPAPPVVENSIQTTSFLVNTPGLYTFGMNITYSCLPGHVFPDEASNKSITCQQNNTWSWTPESCQIIYCPVPENITHGTTVYTTLHYGSQVTSFCDSEHRNKDGSTSVLSFCSANKTWDPPISTCYDVTPFRSRILCQKRIGYQINDTSMVTLPSRSMLDCAARCVMINTCVRFTFLSHNQLFAEGIYSNCKLYAAGLSEQKYVEDDLWDVYELSTSCE